MKILFITGDEYSAMSVEQQIGIDKAVQLTHKNGGSLTIENDDMFAKLSILNFSSVDIKFIQFIKEAIMDYDQSKNTNFYVIGEDVAKE